MSRDQSNHDAAVQYAESFGFRVFPCWPVNDSGSCGCDNPDCTGNSRGKHPIGALCRNGCLGASDDLQVIDGWWEKCRSANVSIATGAHSGVWVLDVDSYKSVEPGEPTADEWLAQLELDNSPLPKTVMCRTGSGGRQLYFRYDSACRMTTGNGVGHRHIDVKSDGGYVVAPWSRNGNGSYCWIPGHSPFECEIAVAPTWFMETLQPGDLTVGPSAAQTGHNHQVDNTTRQMVAEALQHLDPDDREEWRNAGFALHSIDSSRDMLNVWDEWSSQSCKYQPGECESMWGKMKQKIGSGWLFRRARDSGWHCSAQVNGVFRRLDDSIPASSHSESLLARIEYKPVPASELGGEEQMTWLWDGFIAAGHITLLVGLWKAGKTTLLAHLVRMHGDGGSLAGEVHPANVLVITEESGAIWAQRRDTLAIGDHAHFVVRPFRAKPSRVQWEDLIRQVAGMVERSLYQVIVIDTFQSVSPCWDENDSAKMMATLLPLLQITEAGGALLILHHPRKGDAGEGQASRGSGALTGFVDVILELRRFDAERPNDTRRSIRAYSRFDQTPAETIIELTPDGYVAIGDKADVRQADRLAAIHQILSASNESMSADDVRAAWDDDSGPRPGKRTLGEDLKHGWSNGLWSRSGQGRRGDPLVYFIEEGAGNTVNDIGVTDG